MTYDHKKWIFINIYSLLIIQCFILSSNTKALSIRSDVSYKFCSIVSYKFDIINIEFYDLEIDVAMYACLQNRHSRINKLEIDHTSYISKIVRLCYCKLMSSIISW